MLVSYEIAWWHMVGVALFHFFMLSFIAETFSITESKELLPNSRKILMKRLLINNLFLFFLVLPFYVIFVFANPDFIHLACFLLIYLISYQTLCISLKWSYWNNTLIFIIASFVNIFFPLSWLWSFILLRKVQQNLEIC